MKNWQAKYVFIKAIQQFFFLLQYYFLTNHTWLKFRHMKQLNRQALKQRLTFRHLNQGIQADKATNNSIGLQFLNTTYTSLEKILKIIISIPTSDYRLFFTMCKVQIWVLYEFRKNHFVFNAGFARTFSMNEVYLGDTSKEDQTRHV